MYRTLTLTLLTTLLLPATALAAGEEPAGGAATGEIVIATLGASIATAILLVLGFGHRSGRVKLLGRLGAFSSKVSGLPPWAALPSGVATFSLLTAVFGMYWDIALHIDVGRDAGPLANPAHYFILVGLFGIFSAGFLAMVMPKDKPSRASIQIQRGWHAPLGGVLIAACGAFALIGFPLDDMWHRLFGQDVTLWGPTHLMLIGGASMTLLGIAVLMVEGLRYEGKEGPANELTWAAKARAFSLTGGLMIGLSTFQAEFDFGVPQFRFVFQPLLIMLAAGVGLVAVRSWAGRGAALGAVGFFLLVRGFLAISVGPVLGQTTPHFPLYIVAAIVVELVALRVSREQPLKLGLLCGIGIGTIGLASEYGWSHLFAKTPWPTELLPEAIAYGFAVALAGSMIGAWIGARLHVDGPVRERGLRWAAVAGAAVIAVAVLTALQKPDVEGVRAAVTLTEVRPAPDRAVRADVKITPAAKADDAKWVNVTAWQGSGLVLDNLERVGPGHFVSTHPIPVNGNWKSILRLHTDRAVMGVPLFLPKDVAIPAPEVPARPQSTQTFIADHKILQREQKETSEALPMIGYGVVAAIALSLLGLLAWGLHRLGATSEVVPPARPKREREVRTGERITPSVA